MEYVPGGELFDHIVHKLKLQEDEAVASEPADRLSAIKTPHVGRS